MGVILAIPGKIFKGALQGFPRETIKNILLAILGEIPGGNFGKNFYEISEKTPSSIFERNPWIGF